MAYGSKEITYNIIQHIAVLDTHSGGWTKELNIVQWGDNAPKYDIRDWDPEHSKCGKGATFTEKELMSLRDALVEYFKVPESERTPDSKAQISKVVSALKG